ncbi:MAG: hypothetical protein NVS4B3_03190 [Gemmatimonadaceae bacterium]
MAKGQKKAGGARTGQRIPPAAETENSTPVGERRNRSGFRALIDEMLSQLRETSRKNDWTPEARARAEADLARIMESVRQEAMNRRGSD